MPLKNINVRGHINVGDGCWRPNVLVTSLDSIREWLKWMFFLDNSTHLLRYLAVFSFPCFFSSEFSSSENAEYILFRLRLMLGSLRSARLMHNAASCIFPTSQNIRLVEQFNLNFKTFFKDNVIFKETYLPKIGSELRSLLSDLKFRLRTI